MKCIKSLKTFMGRVVPVGEDGAILAVVLIFMAILLVVGSTATLILTTDMQIGSNYKASEKALYVAEAGAHEGRERLRLNSDYPITDNHTDKAQWTAYIGTDTKSQKKGYDSTNSMHVRVAGLQTDMDYTVVITHQVDASGNVLYWGDSDDDGDFERHTDASKNHPNLYVITSYGRADNANKIIQLEATRVPPVTAKAALYTGTSANILGVSGTKKPNKLCSNRVTLSPDKEEGVLWKKSDSVKSRSYRF